MSSNTRVDLNLLKSYKTSFDNEKQGYMYNAYNTFSGGYISKCSDPYVIRMKQDLSYRYQFISEAYNKINTWWTNYNKDLESLENGLCNNQPNSNGISEAAVITSVTSLPTLSNLNINSYMSFEDRKKKAEEYKKHYSQKAAPVTPIEIKTPGRFSANTKKDNSIKMNKDYEAPVVKEAWYKKAGKGVMDFGSGAWATFESGIDLLFTGVGDGLTYVKAGATVVIGSVVETVAMPWTKKSFKDVGYANKEIWAEANAEVKLRNEKHEAKADEILNHAIYKQENYSLDDYMATLPADVADVGYNFGKGVVGVGEKVRDAVESTGSIIIQPIYYGIGKANGLSNEEIKSNMTAQREETMAEIADDECQIYMFDDIEQSEAGQWVQEHSDLTDAEKGLAQGVGELAGELALSYAIGGAIASHGVSGVASFSTASKAVVAGEAMTPVSMGIAGAVTGYGSGIQEAYSDGAGYWEGIGYASINAAIEGGSMAAGGATNMYVFRAENMGASYMLKGSLARITIDTGCGVTEAYARTLTHGIYKRKEDGTLYSVDELYEMYGGDEAIQQNVIMAFGGSVLGEMGEMRQAYKLSQMENAIASGDPAKLAKKMNNMKPNDFADYMKFAKESDIEVILSNVSSKDIVGLSQIANASSLKKFLEMADENQKSILKSSLSDEATKVLINDITDEMLDDLLKDADDKLITKVIKTADSKEIVEKVIDKTDKIAFAQAIGNLDGPALKEFNKKYNDVMVKVFNENNEALALTAGGIYEKLDFLRSRNTDYIADKVGFKKFDNIDQKKIVNKINKQLRKGQQVNIGFSSTKELSSEMLEQIDDLSNVKITIYGGFADLNGNFKTKYDTSGYLDRITYSGTETLDIVRKLEYLESKVDMNLPTVSRARQIYEILSDEIPVNRIETDSHTVKASLRGLTANNVNGKAGLVCAGYAQTYKELCERCNIKCEYIRGLGVLDNTSEMHAWNIVFGDNGEMIPVDVTWRASGAGIYFGASEKFAASHIADSNETLNYFGSYLNNANVVDNIIGVMDAKYGSGAGLKSLILYDATGDSKYITRTVRDSLENISPNQIKIYLESMDRETRIKASIDAIKGVLDNKYPDKSIATNQLNKFLDSGNADFITRDNGARIIASQLTAADISYYKKLINSGDIDIKPISQKEMFTQQLGNNLDSKKVVETIEPKKIRDISEFHDYSNETGKPQIAEFFGTLTAGGGGSGIGEYNYNKLISALDIFTNEPKTIKQLLADQNLDPIIKEQIEKISQTKYGKQLLEMDSEMIRSLSLYIGDGYKGINRQLSTGIKTTNFDADRIINGMDSIYKKSGLVLDEDVLLHRSTNVENLLGMFDDDITDIHSIVGKEINSKTYLSTGLLGAKNVSIHSNALSVNGNVDCILDIKTPKGTIVAVPGIIGVPGESEFILNRNTKLLFENVEEVLDDSGKNCYRIIASVVDNGSNASIRNPIDLFSLNELPIYNKIVRKSELANIKKKISLGETITPNEKMLLSKLDTEFKIDKLDLNGQISDLEKKINEIHKSILNAGSNEELVKELHQAENKLTNLKSIKWEIEDLIDEVQTKYGYKDLGKLGEIKFDEAVNCKMLSPDSPLSPPHVPEEVQKYSDTLAEKIKEYAKEFEPTVSAELNGLEKDNLFLIGEDYRLKGKGSLSRKLIDEAMETDNSKISKVVSIEDVEIASKDIKDSLRYTFISDIDGYSENVKKTLSELEKMDYRIVKFGNSWGPDRFQQEINKINNIEDNGRVYQGINVGLEKIIDGRKIITEVQFHTIDSFATKEKLTHSLYEVSRNRFVPDDIVDKANSIQKTYQKFVPVPDGVSSFPKELTELIEYIRN